MLLYGRLANKQVTITDEEQKAFYIKKGYEIFELTPKKGEKGKFNKKVIHKPETAENLKEENTQLKKSIAKLQKEIEQLKAK